MQYLSRGFAPRTPLHAPSLALTRSHPGAWLARFATLASSTSPDAIFVEGLRPSNSPTRALARADALPSGRVARSLRYARVVDFARSNIYRGASPLELPYTRPRSR